MKGMISLNTHNILDYVGGIVLLICPPIFGFSDVPAASNFFTYSGIALIVYSLFTRYNYSIAKLIPLGLHMGLDVTLGILTVIAPWVFGYNGALSGGQIALHFILGLGVI